MSINSLIGLKKLILGGYFVEKYEIGVNTLAVVGIGRNKAKIVESEEDLIVDIPAYEVMDHSCCYYGSSYSGRTKGSKEILKCEYKLPIIVEETREIIFFPTHSPSISGCIWISLENIDFVEGNQKQCNIVFKNGRKLSISRSKDSIENQLYRATRLKYLLSERKK